MGKECRTKPSGLPAGRGCVGLMLLAIAGGAFLSTSHAAVDNPGTDPNVTTPQSFIRDGRLDVNAVVDYFEDLYRADSSIATARLIVTKPRRTQTMQLKMWTRGQDKALILIEAPAREEGIATLRVGDNLWNYFPRIHRTIRIPPSMMQSAWMGSNFTNDDLVRESKYSTDYFHELVGRAEDPNGWMVRFTAKPETVGLWQRFDLVVSLDGTIPIQAKYYDRKGRHARTMYWSDVKVFDGRRLPAHMTLIPEGEPGQKTELIYLDIDFNVQVPERTFSLSELERTR
jgi:outer membrane lipoprotein-sorting protein